MSFKTDVLTRVKLLLGGSVLKLEVSDDEINSLMELAYDKIKPYILDTRLISKPWSQVIDLSEDKVDDVVRVFRATESYTNYSEKQFDFEAVKIDRRSVVNAVLGSYPLIDSEIHFRYEKPILYLDVNSSYTSSVTIEAATSPELDELRDENAKSWIFSYTLALCKQVIGRIRSKFRSGNIPIEMDGDTLLSEASSEIERLESELQDKNFGPIYYMSDNKS